MKVMKTAGLRDISSYEVIKLTRRLYLEAKKKVDPKVKLALTPHLKKLPPTHTFLPTPKKGEASTHETAESCVGAVDGAMCVSGWGHGTTEGKNPGSILSWISSFSSIHRTGKLHHRWPLPWDSV